MIPSSKWNDRYLRLCEEVGSWSKDPSTKVGAVIVRPNMTLVNVGYNGFPAGVDDASWRYEDRATKLRMVVHAEINAIVLAEKSVKGCILYITPFPPCAPCAAIVIQSGIATVVTRKPDAGLLDRWGADLEIAASMFQEAGVQLIYQS